MITLLALVWGQCTPALQAEVKADKNYKSKFSSYDVLWLLQTCKKLITSVESRGNKYVNAYRTS